MTETRRIVSVIRNDGLPEVGVETIKTIFEKM
jgi:hypothetical protein